MRFILSVLLSVPSCSSGSTADSTQDTKTKVVLDILHSIAESENFLVPSVRRDNAKELATEMLRKVDRARVEGALVVSEEYSASLPTGESVFVEEFSKFCSSLVDRIKDIAEL